MATEVDSLLKIHWTVYDGQKQEWNFKKIMDVEEKPDNMDIEKKVMLWRMCRADADWRL